MRSGEKRSGSRNGTCGRRVPGSGYPLLVAMLCALLFGGCGGEKAEDIQSEYKRVCNAILATLKEKKLDEMTDEEMHEFAVLYKQSWDINSRVKRLDIEERRKFRRDPEVIRLDREMDATFKKIAEASAKQGPGRENESGEEGDDGAESPLERLTRIADSLP